MYDQCPVVPHESEIRLLSFLSNHISPLLDAAGLIGGADAIRDTARLFEHIADHQCVTVFAFSGLQNLLDLLQLKHLDRPTSESETRFLDLDPADPAVEEICLLADQLAALLGAFVFPAPPSLASVVARKAASAPKAA